MQEYDVAIVGAGPAGMMAAIFAAREGAKVVLLEKNSILGRKLLATGNGRCNISNTGVQKSRYHGSGLTLFESVLGGFTAADTKLYFESLGVILKEEDRGRLFPITNQAQTVVTALQHELENANVETRLGSLVKNIEKSSDGWSIQFENLDAIIAKNLVLTTGGKAAHQFGSSGDGLFWAKKLGLEVTPIRAALVALESNDDNLRELSGLKVGVNAEARSDGSSLANSNGDMIFTHFGVSGPAVMSLAGALFENEAGKKTILANFLPEMSGEDLDLLISKQFESHPKRSIKTIVAAFLPARLAEYLICKAGVNPEMKAAETSRTARLKLAREIQGNEIVIDKARPLKEAQVTRGGIPANELTNELESVKLPGLYFAGEIVDIDGDSGGFNLQWAWSSGVLVGVAAARNR